MDVRRSSLRHGILACASLAGCGIAVLGTGLRERLASGLAEVDRADPALLGLTALVFASGLVCSGLAWRTGLAAAGARMSAVDATSRYVTGSLVSSLVPLRAGGAVRLALYHRVARDVRAVAGVAACIGAVRVGTLAALVGVASTIVPVPAWSALAMVGVGAGAGTVAWKLGRGPAGMCATAACAGSATAARVIAAALVAHAFDAPRPLLAGAAIVAAMEAASTLPLTPGNAGLSTAAAAFVLAAVGLPGDVAVAAGLSLAMLETATSIVLGLAGLAYLTTGDRAGRPSPATRTPASSSAGGLAGVEPAAVSTS